MEVIDQTVRADGTVAFLPHRLNRYPIVVRGLTADELWICTGLSAALGFALGIVLAFTFGSFPLIPTSIIVAISLGIYYGGSALRRLKRGRPDIWLYRQLQWKLTIRYPSLAHFIGGDRLVTRSGFWTTRRSRV